MRRPSNINALALKPITHATTNITQSKNTVINSGQVVQNNSAANNLWNWAADFFCAKRNQAQDSNTPSMATSANTMLTYSTSI